MIMLGTPIFQQSPPRPARNQISVNCSIWQVYADRDAFGRQWILRGLRGHDDITTIEISVNRDHIVTMILEPGIAADAAAVKAQLAVDGQPDAPFLPLQHRPIHQRGATVFAPTNLEDLKMLLHALWQGAGMNLTLIASDREVLQAPLYNDPSYREIFREISA
jgi:hypothetical protein